jgi:hypothetical protein
MCFPIVFAVESGAPGAIKLRGPLLIAVLNGTSTLNALYLLHKKGYVCNGIEDVIAVYIM